MFENLETLKQNLIKKCFEKLSKNIKNCFPNLEKSRSGGGLGALGGDLGTKKLSKDVLADFGQFWPGSERRHWHEKSFKSCLG